MASYELRPLRYKHEVHNRIYGVFRSTMPDRPLFIVAPSAALLRKGIRGQLGLYAGVDFPESTHVGAYDGDVIGGPFDSVKDASTCDAAEEQDRLGNTMLLVRKTRDGTHEVVNGRTSGPPYLCLCNDHRGTRMPQNVRTTEFGNLYTTRDVPGFRMDDTLYANGASELLSSYGNKKAGGACKRRQRRWTTWRTSVETRRGRASRSTARWPNAIWSSCGTRSRRCTTRTRRLCWRAAR